MRVVTCTCGETFEARHPRAKFCSDRCRKRKERAPGDVVVLPGAVPVEEEPAPESGAGPIETATRRELEECDRLATSLGQVVLALARRLDNGGRETGSAYSALAARFEATKAAATKGAAVATSPSQLNDEVAARRAMHA